MPDAGKWKVETSTSDGYVCYDLVRKPASVHIAEIDADVALPAEWLKGAGMAASFDSADGVKAFAEGAGANGIPVWQSYCLGLDPNEAESVVLCEAAAAQPGSGCIAIKAGNVDIPAELEGARVSATLERMLPGGDFESVTNGTFSSGAIVLTTPEIGPGLSFFRIRVGFAAAPAAE